MDSLRRLIREVMSGHPLGWTLDDRKLTVQVGREDRHQDIHFDRIDDMYVITTTVLGSRTVRRTRKGWNKFALLAWQRNADQELVTFGFTDDDRLVGRICHPAEHLDAAELDVYVRALSRECDRFEYLLTGRDEF
jgi:hypothetical protein